MKQEERKETRLWHKIRLRE